MIVRAQRSVPAGGELTISYAGEVLPLDVRRQHLHSMYGFTCTCELCQDQEDFLRKEPGKIMVSLWLVNPVSQS
jgi:hypothetical protein